MDVNRNQHSVHIVPTGCRLPDIQLAHQLPLPFILDIGVDQLFQAPQVDAALSLVRIGVVSREFSIGERNLDAECKSGFEVDVHKRAGSGPMHNPIVLICPVPRQRYNNSGVPPVQMVPKGPSTSRRRRHVCD